ncbi:MAG: hypothetical protein WCX82_00550 [archaeon]|jgi:hypothetical protein
MELNILQLNVFLEICKENIYQKELAIKLDKSKSQISRAIAVLSSVGLIEYSKRKLELSKNPFSTELKELLFKYPNLMEILKDSGIPILQSFLTEKTVKEISQETKLKEITIYKFIEKTKNLSILIKQKNKYIFNEKLWHSLKEFIIDYNYYNNNTDNRIPKGSIIYYKNKKEIIFSTQEELSNFIKTGFSVFKDYGINILNTTNYYSLSNKKLTLIDILEHTMTIVEKTKDYRQLLYLVLFFQKYRKSIRYFNKPQLLLNIISVLDGKTIDGYPTLKEIKEKVKLYNIKI